MLDVTLGADSQDAPRTQLRSVRVYMAADVIKAVTRQLVGRTGGRRQPNLAVFCQDYRLRLG